MGGRPRRVMPCGFFITCVAASCCLAMDGLDMLSLLRPRKRLRTKTQVVGHKIQIGIGERGAVAGCLGNLLCKWVGTHGMILVWHGVVWHGMVWHGRGQCGRLDQSLNPTPPFRPQIGFYICVYLPFLSVWTLLVLLLVASAANAAGPLQHQRCFGRG